MENTHKQAQSDIYVTNVVADKQNERISRIFSIYKSGNHFLLTVSDLSRTVVRLMSSSCDSERVCCKQAMMPTNAELKIRKLSLRVLIVMD